MAQLYPAALPEAQSTRYASKGISQFATTEFDSGRKRNRRMYPRAPIEHEIRWLYTGEELRIFRAWYEHALQGGAETFYMNVWADSQFVKRECQFTDAPQIEMNERKQNEWAVSAKIEVLDHFSDEQERIDDVFYTIAAKISHHNHDGAGGNIIIGTIDVDHTVEDVYVVTLIPLDGSGNKTIDVGLTTDSNSLVSGLRMDLSPQSTKYNETIVVDGSLYEGIGLKAAKTTADLEVYVYQAALTQVTDNATEGEFLIIVRYTKQ